MEERIGAGRGSRGERVVEGEGGGMGWGSGGMRLTSKTNDFMSALIFEEEKRQFCLFTCVCIFDYVHITYRVFIKYYVFSLKFCDSSELCQLCCSACVLPACFVYTH